ncbi:MAG: GNAT family N-acetyltransferase [Anaerolineae bacterium]|nr:GNAT family N-acetyltransferase [Anaerolineae bacterium]
MQNSTINPAPPPIAGLLWRPLSPADLSTIAELARACHLVDGGLAFMIQPDNLQQRYFPDAPGAAIGAFTPDGHLVACAAVYHRGEAASQPVSIAGQVRPDWRRKGIGAYLLHWSQEVAQQLLAERTTGPRMLQIATESLTAPADRLYRAHGFAPVFEELVMRHDLRLPLPDYALPPDVALTSWQPDLAEQFFQAYDAAFRDRPGFPGWRAAEWLAWIVDDYFRPEWSLLARVAGTPVGFLVGTAEPPDGFVLQVGVAPVMRRRKLGSALLVEAMQRMKADGAASTQLTVNTNNPGAIQTYTQLGFATIGRRARYQQ